MTLSPNERDNLLQWDGRQRGFYEVYYLKWNEAASRTACWIRYTLTSPLPRVGAPYCELWGIFFDVDHPEKNFAVKNRFPSEQLTWDTDRFRIGIAQGELTHHACHARIEHEGHVLAWDLTFASSLPTYRYFPYASFYRGAFPKTKGVSPHVDARFDGTVEADGRTIRLHDAAGQQTHLWGTQHAQRWAWGHSNTCREDPTALWEGLDAQIKVGPVLSPHFKLFYVRWQGRDYFFNDLSAWLRNESDWQVGRWTFALKNEELRIEGAAVCRFDELVAVTYMDPNGDPLWCHNSKIASLRLSIYDREGEHLAELTSEHGAAAEFVDRVAHPQVPVRI